MGGRGAYAERKKQERTERRFAEQNYRDPLYGTVMGRHLASIRGATRVDMARHVTPESLDRGQADGPLADHMWGMFAYRDDGSPVYREDKIRESWADTMYDVYTLGRGYVEERHAAPVQMRAAGLLAAEEYSDRKVFTRAERNQLRRLADSDTLYSEIDRIRDKRLAQGGLATGRAAVKKNKRFLTAAQYDAREQVLDWRRERAS